MSTDVLDDLILDDLLSDDDVSGSFALDELLGDASEDFLSPDDLDNDFFSTPADSRR